MSVIVRAATDADLPLLAQMNQRLIADEGSTNPMSLGALQQRLAGWLHADWQIEILLQTDTVIGYAIYQLRADTYQPERAVVYVRQFYIEREQRGHGLGRLAFAALSQTCFPADCTITLDVLATNPNGYRFWSALGFQPYYTRMAIEFHQDVHDD